MFRWKAAIESFLLCPPAPTTLSPHSDVNVSKVNGHFWTASFLRLFPLAPTCAVCFVWAQLNCWYKLKYLQHKYWQWKSSLMFDCCYGKGHSSARSLLFFCCSLFSSVFAFLSVLLARCWPTCIPRVLQTVTMADRFDCDHCKESLYGRKYIQSDDSPYCIPCYDSLFSNTCDECKELIGHDARVRHPFLRDRTCHQLCAAQTRVTSWIRLELQSKGFFN